MTELANTLEAILFYQAEPLTVKRLSALVKHSEQEVHEALIVLEKRLSETGLRLLSLGDEVALGTAPEASAFIEAITKEELSKDLSKASLETLAIVLYKGPITRAEIDYIRGVNSTFILRNLLVRGLVEKIDNPNDQRSFWYRPTFQLLEFMGVSSVSELPEYESTMVALAQFVTAKEDAEKEDQKETTATTVVAEQSDEGIIPDLSSDEEVGVDTDSPESDLDATLDEVDEIDDADEMDDDMSDSVSDDVEADIAEEDVAIGNFADEEIEGHLLADEERAS